tara:strand:+ start:13081 stop:14274 length:1194 start_codon:yes stop_codon:yes gene_type:complete
MNLKIRSYNSFFCGLISLCLFIKCSPDSSTVEYFRSERNGDFKARIVVDSTMIYRNDRNNGQLSVDIKYKAVLLDSDIDSIEWLFPDGNPENAKETLSTSINYSNYGTFNSKLILTKVDTVNLNNIYSYKDTIEISNPIRIAYKETNWSTFITTDDPNWLVLPNNQNVIIRENQIFEDSDPFEAYASFKGFNNKKLKFSIDYKLTYKNPLNDNITQNPKIDVLIDDLKAFGVSGVSNDKYFTQEFFVDNLNDFDFKIKKYPSITSSNWQLSLTASSTTLTDIDITLYDLVNQNKIIGYLNLEQTSTSTETTSYQALLNTTINGTKYNFGIKNQSIVLDGDPITIKPGSNYKIIFNTEDSLPKSFEILNENFTTTPVNIENNEYYIDATFKKLFISVE